MKSVISKKWMAILFLLLSFAAKTQVTVEWSNAPGGVALATDQLNNVYSAYWDYNPAGDIYLTKRSTDGNILWNVSYNNTDNTRHEVVTWLEADSQNNCLVAGTIRSGYSNPVNAASLLMKYDTNGNLLWRTVFESSFEGSYTRKVLVDSADNIYVLGLGTGSNGVVTRVKKFDPNGTPIWTFYDSTGIGSPINFKFTPDNALLVSGRSIYGIINGYLKLGLDGNLIWTKPGITSITVGDAAGDSYGNTFIINSNNVGSFAGSVLEKFDPSGNLMWSRTNAMAGMKVEIGSDENPIISGFPNAGTAGAAFMKYDYEGNVSWQNLDADGAETLLLHGRLIVDAANNAYLSAGNLFNMAVCKVNADGTNGWVALVSGSNSAQSFVMDTNESMYIIGTTTAKLSEDCSTAPTDLDVIEIGFGTDNPRVNAMWTNPYSTTDCEVRGGRIAQSSIGTGSPQFANINNTRVISQTNGSTLMFNIVLYNNPNIPFSIGQTYGYEVRCRCEEGTEYSNWSGLTPESTFIVPSPPSPFTEGQSTDEAKGLNETELSIFPNPNNGEQLMILLNGLDDREGTVHLELLDMMGRHIQSERISTKGDQASYQMTFEERLPSGMYLIRVSQQSVMLTERLVVE